MAEGKLELVLARDSDGYSIQVAREAQAARQRKQRFRITFLDTASQRAMVVPRQSRMREYCNEREEFVFTNLLKIDRFSGRDNSYQFQCFIPFKMFDWLGAGSLVTLKAERIEESGVVSAVGFLELMINSNNQLTTYSYERYLQYLVQWGGSEEKYAFARRYVEKPDVANASQLIELLMQLADAETSGDAEMLLYRLNANESFAHHNDATAQEWLMRAGRKHQPDACRLLGELQPEAVLTQAAAEGAEEAPVELEAVLASAKNGNREAQFMLFELYSDRESGDCDPQEGYQWLQRAVESGHNGAVDKLEEYFLTNFPVDADAQRYTELLKTAAHAGSTQACCKLFETYYTGECLRRPVVRDKRCALDYLRKAADGGSVCACYRMWQLFEDGNDLLMSEKDAVALLQKAADSGDAYAMNDLGELYVQGRIVEKNGAKGVELIRGAAQRDCFEAQMRVFHMALEGRYSDILFDIEKQKAYALLLGYAKEKANPMAQVMLWQTYLDGNPVMLTRMEALGFLRAAARLDYLPAMFLLAKADLDGRYKDIDVREGKKLLEHGAKKGGAEAQFALYQLYFTGNYYALECPVNKERAFKWITLSAQSHSGAKFGMWRLYEDGNEMGLEQEEALELLFSAARQDCCDALYTTALLYARGNLVPADCGEAMKYLQRAAELQHPQALFKLYEVLSSGRFETLELEQDAAVSARMLLLSAGFEYEPACREVVRLFASGNPLGVDNTFAEECRARIPAKERGQVGAAKPPKPEQESAPLKAEEAAERRDNAPVPTH